VVWSSQNWGWAATCSRSLILAVKAGTSKIVLSFTQAIGEQVEVAFQFDGVHGSLVSESVVHSNP
jgi:hypothetical protein